MRELKRILERKVWFMLRFHEYSSVEGHSRIRCTHVWIWLMRQVRTSLIRSISLYFLNMKVSFLMECLESIKGVHFYLMLLINHAMLISYFLFATLLQSIHAKIAPFFILMKLYYSNLSNICIYLNKELFSLESDSL